MSETRVEQHPQGLGRRLGLRAQILLGLAAVTLVAILITGYLSLWAAGDNLRDLRESEAITLVSAASRMAAAIVERHGSLESPECITDLGAAFKALVERSDGLELSVLSQDRRVVAAWPPRRPSDDDPPIAAGVLTGIPPVSLYRDVPGSGGKRLLAYSAIEVSGRVGRTILGAARVALPAPAPVKLVVRRSGWFLLSLSCIDALLVLALGYLVLTQMVVRPLRKLRRATAQVSSGDWDQRIEQDGPREVAALAQAFNQMTSSLAGQREQLIRSEKLASVGQLAAGVAHEIGNPLAAILGYIDILRTEGAGQATLSPEERHDALTRVKSETQRINRIIRDLLEYSRPSLEEPIPTDPLRVVHSAQSLLAPQARLRKVRIAVSPETGQWPNVMVSPGRLAQVLVNLLLNAADAMDGDGIITVACTAERGRVRLSVADQGPGIAPELRRKVFDPFFTTKPPGQGTGLGLSISRSIIETYGGTLELASAAEKGAAFVIELPSAEDGRPAVGG